MKWTIYIVVPNGGPAYRLGIGVVADSFALAQFYARCFFPAIAHCIHVYAADCDPHGDD